MKELVCPICGVKIQTSSTGVDKVIFNYPSRNPLDDNRDNLFSKVCTFVTPEREKEVGESCINKKATIVEKYERKSLEQLDMNFKIQQ